MEERESKRRSREGVRWLIRERIMEELQERHHMDDGELLEMIDRSIGEMGQEIFLPLKERLWLRGSLFDSFRRLDILQELIDDSSVSEIMVNGAGKIFMERNGRMELWDRNFERPEQLEDIIQQIVSRVNRVVNVSSPMVDARLEDGSRVHVVLPPVALDGPVVTIRKFPDPITMEKLIRFKAISTEAAGFLEQLVEDGCNMFISGGTNSGKTTFLNALSSFIPSGERVITIEDSAELQITQVPNLVRLETRNANTEGEGGFGHAPGHEHRPSRKSFHRSWEQPAGHDKQTGNHGADGGGPSAGSNQEPDCVGPGHHGPSGPAEGWEKKSFIHYENRRFAKWRGGAGTIV